jgi:hypothetical protein
LWNSITNPNSYSHCDRNSNRHADRDRDRNCHCHASSYSYAKTHSNPEIPSLAKAPSHSAASSVTDAKQLYHFKADDLIRKTGRQESKTAIPETDSTRARLAASDSGS